MNVRVVGALVALCAGACVEEQWPPLPEPCASQPDERLCSARTVTVDGVERQFIVSHLHVDDCARGPLPVVFAWHGNSGNGEELRGYLEVERALGGRMTFVYPFGLPREELGGSTGWDRDPGGVDVAFFDAMRDALADDACVDLSNVFSVGHSRGGRFVDTLGCARADAHRAMASISAGADNVDPRDCGGGVPVWLTHGRNDGVVWFSEGERLRDAWAARNGCQVPGWFDTFPTNECTELRACDEETVFCPSDVEEWDGHFPAPFSGPEIGAFFLRHVAD